MPSGDQMKKAMESFGKMMQSFQQQGQQSGGQAAPTGTAPSPAEYQEAYRKSLDAMNKLYEKLQSDEFKKSLEASKEQMRRLQQQMQEQQQQQGGKAPE
jgi:hypothetical protein